MQFIEYGNEHADVIVLLHGGGLSWWNYRDVALGLRSDFHVILPILDGHAGSDAPFTTIEQNAEEIIAFIEERFGGSVLLIGGLSLGGQILLEILSRRREICRYALIESALVVPSRFTHAMIEPAFGSCFGLIRRRWFARLQFRSLKIRPELFEDYFRDTCGITRADMIAFLQANSLYTVREALADCRAKAHIFVGARENRAMRRSADLIHKALAGSTLTILPKLHHGEFSINHPDDCADAILEIVRGGQ